MRRPKGCTLVPGETLCPHFMCPVHECSSEMGCGCKANQLPRHTVIKQAQEDIEAVVAMAEASVDWAPQEVDALLRWLKAFAAMRLVEREIEEWR